eukprot:8088665-Heterocapsa_arctica.AAC.1
MVEGELLVADLELERNDDQDEVPVRLAPLAHLPARKLHLQVLDRVEDERRCGEPVLGCHSAGRLDES